MADACVCGHRLKYHAIMNMVASCSCEHERINHDFIGGLCQLCGCKRFKGVKNG